MLHVASIYLSCDVLQIVAKHQLAGKVASLITDNPSVIGAAELTIVLDEAEEVNAAGVQLSVASCFHLKQPWFSWIME